MAPQTGSPSTPRSEILLTGATGYVGGLLLDRLIATGRSVRAVSRSDKHDRDLIDAGATVAHADVSDPASLTRIFDGIGTAYYLVHAMEGGADFADRDRDAAEAFGQAAAKAGVTRIVYLGGLGDDDDSKLSEHLASRHEVGRVLAASGVPTIEFRAAMIVGAGSLSFRLVQALTERLPVMLCPTWLRTPTQPIAVADVLDYLVGALDRPADESQVYQIGGPDVLTYDEIIREYARQRGLRRVLIPVPVLSPKLSGLWLSLVTPGLSGVGRHLIEGLRNPTTVTDDRAKDIFAVRPTPIRQAIHDALEATVHPTASDHLPNGQSTQATPPVRPA